jgi:drug/metabolite transporter (DMT)-like permease
VSNAAIMGLVLFAVLLASGQVLFKLAARQAPVVRQFSDLGGLLVSHWLWLALVLYGLATILWVLLLQRVPLSRAYPFAALGFVLVPAAGVLIFAERVSTAYVIGTAMIIGGIFITSGVAK